MNIQIDDKGLEKIAKFIADEVLNNINNSDLNDNDTYNEYMNKKEASKYVGVGMNTFDKFVKSGLKAIVIGDGTATRFSKTTIDNFMKQNEK